MKIHLTTLLTSIIGSALYSQQVSADLAGQCLLKVPTYTKPLVDGKSSTLPIHIQADKVTVSHPDHALFIGNVHIEQGNSTLTANEVQLTQLHKQNQNPLRIVTATGNVNYISNEIKLQGPKAWYNLNTKDTDLYHGNYHMVGRQGRGTADTIRKYGDNRYTVLKNGSFTSCLLGDNSWSVVGSEVIHDFEKQIAEIWNARFKIGKMLVFYSPYLQIPVGDKRRSGFLVANSKYNNDNGLEFNWPYYLNLAPNYDATITPNCTSKRGIQIRTELRYLTTPGDGQVEFDWLFKDKVNKNAYANNSDRWLLYWHHNGVIDQIWRLYFDYTKVSDSNYFNDLDSKYGNSTDSYTTQKFCFGYTNKNWDSTLSYKQFKIFDSNIKDAYRITPSFDFTYYQNNIGPFDFKLSSQVAKFTNINNDYPEAVRFHIEPTLNLHLPLVNRYGNFNTEAKLMATYYQQKNIDYYNEFNTTGYYLNRSVNRIFPQFKTNGSMILERNMNYAPDYKQTLEPRLQYLYIPYRNQNNIGIYDSTILQTDYYSLFHDRIYSGLDRISSANQLTSSITTRIYDNQSVERFNISIGQIYYFSRPRIDDINSILSSCDNISNIIWAGDSYWYINDRLGVRGDLQYDPSMRSIKLSNEVLEYRYDENHILQLNYRYANQKYITQMLSSTIHSKCEHSISQVGIAGSWLLVDRWSLVGAYYYDTKSNQPVDQLVCLQYKTCCWAINIGCERKIAGWNNTNCSSKYDKKVSFNIELRGLRSNYNQGADKVLESCIIPYQRTF